jgi:hypothetical protein
MLAVLLLLGVFLMERTAYPPWMVDIFPQQLGAYFWKTGQPEWMYTPVAKNMEWRDHRAPVANQLGAEGDPNTFLYPPFVAAVLAPLSETPAALWKNVLFGINILMIFVLAYQAMRISGARTSWRSFLWSLALILLCYPMARAMKLGQIVPILVAMCWAGLILLQRRREWAGAMVLGLVSAIKIFPFALILIPLAGQRIRAAAVWAGTVLAIFAVSLISMGIEVHRYWWEVMREFSGLVQPFFGNNAPLGWFARIYYHRPRFDVIPLSTPLLDTLRICGLIIFLGATVFVLWRKRQRLLGDDLALSAGLLLSGLHLALPIMWEHYWIFLLPPLAWALRRVWLFGKWDFWDLELFTAAFFFLMKLTRFYGDDTLGLIMTGSQTWGMFLLWIWFLHALWNLPDVDATVSRSL